MKTRKKKTKLGSSHYLSQGSGGGGGVEEKMEALKDEKEGWGVSFDKSKKFSWV